MVNKRLINTGEAAAAFDPLQNFETVTYTGNGSTQKITGYIRKGAAFNGSSSYISANSAHQSSFSVSAWVYANSLTETNWYGSRYDSANLVTIGIDASGKIKVFNKVSNTWSGFTTTSAHITANTWHHVVVNFTSSDTKIYVDGSDISDDHNNHTTSVIYGDSYIGATNTTSVGSYWNGKIDQVRIFDKALSSSEVTTLYGETHASTTKSTTDIFSDNSGVALYQLDGNANDTGTNDFEHHFFVSDAGSSSSSVRLNSTDADFTYTRPSGYSEWGGAFDVNNQSHQFAGSSSYVTLSESNKKWDKSGSYYNAIWGENSYSSGKYYFELEYLGAELFFGIIKQSTATTIYDGNVVKENSISYGSWNTTSYKYSTTNSSQGSALSTNDVLGFAVDFDNRELKYYINNTLQDTTSLQEITYNGTATDVNYLGMAFQPDLVWIKIRTLGYNHYLIDSVRGATEILQSNLADAESTKSTSLTSFDTNGFTVGSKLNVNANTEDFVAWCFKGGGAAVTNTNGTIPSTVSANQDAGFSIVKYTGSGGSGMTVGHGLSSAPEIVFIKNLDAAEEWQVFGITLFDRMNLNDSDADKNNHPITVNSTTFQTSQTSPQEGNAAWNGSGNEYIAYCFHSVDGYQKVGSYTGTGASGNAITTGFQPRFVMQKKSSGTGSWNIIDNQRGDDNYLSANLSNAEGSMTASSFHLTDTGFTLDNSFSEWNASGGTYIYLAIA